MEFDVLTLSIISTVITTVVEIIKAWVPKKYKTEDGILIKRKGKKDFIIPNAAIWPTLSFAVGIVIFVTLKLTLFNEQVIENDAASQAISGAASSLGSNGVYRVKSKLGTILGGDPESSAQNSGPDTLGSTISQVAEVVQDCMTEVSKSDE